MITRIDSLGATLVPSCLYRRASNGCVTNGDWLDLYITK